jgi:excisionase family DNA binding protein
MTDRLLTSGQVAKLFYVDPKTVAAWARRGKLRCIKTPGGHRRFYEADVLALLEEV